MPAPKCRCGHQLEESDKLGAASFVCPNCGKVMRPSRADSAGHPPPMMKPEVPARERSADLVLAVAVALTIAVVGIVVWVLAGRAKPEEKASAEPPAEAAPATPPPAYATDEAGLQRLIEDLIQARRAGDAARVAALIEGLRLPDAGHWFGEHFGEKGAELAPAYDAMVEQVLPAAFGESLDRMRASDDGAIRVTLFRLDAQTAGGDVERSLLGALARPTELWVVEAGGEKLRYFVVAGGRWRTMGKMWSHFR